MADLPNNPISRKEQYLSKAAGQSTELPPYPITREEHYLAAIAEGGGGTFNVNFVFDGDNFVADKTYNEIVAAIDAGNIGIGHLTLYGLPLDLIAFRYDDNGINFSCDYLNIEAQAAIHYFLLLKPDESTVAGRFTYTTTNWMYL